MRYLALSIPGASGGSVQVNPPGGIPTGGFTNNSTTGSNIVSTGIQLLLLTAIVLSLFYLIWGGFKWMTSGGDQEKLAGARQAIIYAVIGLGIAFFSFLIIQLLGNFIGVNLLTF